MDDYQDIEKEYKKIDNYSKLQINNLKNILDKVNVFQSSIIFLNEKISSIPDLSDNPFVFFDSSLKNFQKLLEKNSLVMQEYVIKPLNKLVNNIKEAVNDNLQRLNEIKKELYKESKNLLNKKNNYFNYNLTYDNKIKNKKKDDKMSNYEELYKNELFKMNKTIDSNNEKYKNIKIELNSLEVSWTISVKENLTLFAHQIKNYSEILKLLSFEIINKMESKEFDNKDILDALNEKNKKNEIRFKKEKIENNNNIEIISKNAKINNFILNKSENEEDKNENFFYNVITKLFGTKEELDSKEINKIYNIFITKDQKEFIKYSNIFLNKIKELYKNKIIVVKNKNNFIYACQILNYLSVNFNKNIFIINDIIELSQHICYENIFIYKKLTEKSQFFNNKALWKNIFEISLVTKLNELIEELINKKERKKNKNKIDENKEDNDNIIKILKNLDFFNEIKDYQKLKAYQIKELNKYSLSIVYKILSQLITSASCFKVNYSFVEEIINDYSTIFNLNEEEMLYLKNKAKIKDLIKYTKVFNEKEEKKIIIIYLVSKFLPLTEFPNILKLNKNVYQNLKKEIFLNIFPNKILPINKNMLFWKKCLNIEKIKMKYSYEDIKSKISISIFAGEVNKNKVKNMEIIELDLCRTSFIQKNPTHFNSFKSVLNCFLLTFPKIGYCQGMNCLASFLYQLLEQNEEETFYYLCGLMLNTEYHELFEDDFITLQIFFNTFDNLLYIMKPEIYYKFKFNSILPNFYCSSWFITLFTEYIDVIDKNYLPLLMIFIFNKFIMKNWIAIFTFGISIIEFCYGKILDYNNEILINYMTNIYLEDKIFDNINYEKFREIYLKNEKIINEEFINRLIDISKFEYYHNN